MTQISVTNVGVDFGATTLFKDISFTVGAGERWGIIGRNGSGKTTLFRLITGQMKPTTGSVSLSDPAEIQRFVDAENARRGAGSDAGRAHQGGRAPRRRR